MANLQPILGLVKEKLPFLSDGSKDSLINSEMIQVMYYLQPYLKKTDEKVEEEDEYKPLERILISWLVSYNLLQNKSIELAGGNSSTGEEVNNSFLKKAKADVVEAEFEQLDKKKTVTLAQDTEIMAANMLKQACAVSRTLGININLCAQYKYDMIKPFSIIS